MSEADNKAEDGGVKKANKRGNARLSAVQALYQMDVGGTSLTQTVAEFEDLRIGKEIDGELYQAADVSWFRGIVAGVMQMQDAIDPMIHSSLTPEWPLARIDALLRAVLRAGAFELAKRQDVPAKVVISEYVDVSKAFFDEDEPKMVNGVLDRVAKRIRSGEFELAAAEGETSASPAENPSEKDDGPSE